MNHMIIAIALSVIIPLIILTAVPAVIKHYGKDSKKYTPWLVAACALYIVSWWLPSPLIEGRDTSFTTHFVGGGLFTGCVWMYLKQSFNWRANWLLQVFSLFALVSALGVANELFEIVLYETGHLSTVADTSWDLLANTLGALVFYTMTVFITKH